MLIDPKRKTTSKTFSAAQIAAAKASAAPAAKHTQAGADEAVVDWAKGIVTPGGGVQATIGALRKARGKNKKPTKEQVAIRLEPEVLAAFRANGPGWQTRMNTALKEWLLAHPQAKRAGRAAQVRA
jgi:uncharacterized protein (DUF4415 family)